VVQAQACGLPVVCSDVGGLPENIQDGVTGLLAQNRNSWDVAEKMERLLQDTPTRRRMAINARQHAVEHFDLSKNINQFICMYRSVLHI
jgi:glycosyltransferase involved in cell wall biosynthesis